MAQAAAREAPPLRQVVHGPFAFVAHCERHGMPFFGRVFVGYVPTAERIGPCTVRRMVQQAARHGEHELERQLASMLQVCIKPAGVALAVQSSHRCAGPVLLEADGGRRSTTWYGRYRADQGLRAEFLARCAATRT